MNPGEKEPCVRAEILWEKPLAGVFTEALFGSDRGNTVWIKFSDADGIDEWVGKFGVGGGGAPRLEKVKEPDIFFVTAGCFGYVINATQRVLLNHFEKDFCEALLYDPCRDQFVVSDYLYLRLVRSGATVWTSRRVAIDGIGFLGLEGRLLRGMAVKDFEGGESPFSLNLDTLEIQCDVDCSLWDMPADLDSERPRKPWWKFW